MNIWLDWFALNKILKQKKKFICLVDQRIGSQEL